MRSFLSETARSIALRAIYTFSLIRAARPERSRR
jgi:hypothetical protein